MCVSVCVCVCEPFKVEKLRRTKGRSANIWSDADMDASCFASLRHHIGTKCYSCQPSVFRESHCHSVISYNIQALPPSRHYWICMLLYIFRVVMRGSICLTGLVVMPVFACADKGDYAVSVRCTIVCVCV